MELDVSRRQNLQPLVGKGASGHILDQLTKTIPLVSLGRGIGMHGETIDAEAKFSFGERYLLLIAKP